jgi:hypothetical protein
MGRLGGGVRAKYAWQLVQHAATSMKTAGAPGSGRARGAPHSIHAYLRYLEGDTSRRQREAAV